MIEQIILGAVQGIFEWLPVSSEGLIVLIKSNFFSDGLDIAQLIRIALFLHLGTFLAALLYFRCEVIDLIKALCAYSASTDEKKKTVRFLVIATAISGIWGFALLLMLTSIQQYIVVSSKIIMFGIGVMLLITALLEIRARRPGYRTAADLTVADSVALGVVQGFAVVPGLSRSGLTVSAFLLKKYDKTLALKLSFLMSLPIVLAGNIALNLRYFSFDVHALLGLAVSFIFGIVTIHALLMLSRKINFGYFVLVFALLTVVAALW